jgi:hypothetical protein
VTSTYADAQGVLDRLREAGIDYDDAVRQLEEEGGREVRGRLERPHRVGHRAAREAEPTARPTAAPTRPARPRAAVDGGLRLVSLLSPSNPLRDPRDRRLPRVPDPCALVVFGVTGDLARKKLIPAVYDLANRGLLPPGFALLGFARRDWGDGDFESLARRRRRRAPAPSSASRPGPG